METIKDNIKVHLEVPGALYPELVNTPVQGWIASDRPVEEIWISSGTDKKLPLSLHDRNDVRQTFPDCAHAAGFLGILPTKTIGENVLRLHFQIGGETITHGFNLPSGASPVPFSVLDRLKKVNYALYTDDMEHRNTILNSTPIHMNLEPTNRCNLSCPSCARNYWDENLNEIGYMDPETVEFVAPFLERVSVVGILGYGEAVLSPSFQPIVKRVAQFGPRIILFNNGTTLNSRNIDFILESGVHELGISLDGADDETVSHTRTASLKTIVGNISHLRNRAAEMGTSMPKLTFSFTASRRNIDQITRLLDLGKENGFTEMHIALAKIFHPSLVQDSVFLDQNHATTKIREAQEYGNKLGIKVNVPPPFGAKTFCKQPFESLFVKWNGSARLCCSTAIESDLPLSVVTGNILRDPLEVIWNGKIAQQARAGILGDDTLNDACAECPFMECTLEKYTRFLSK